MRTSDLVAARRIRNYGREVATATARPEFSSRNSERRVMFLLCICERNTNIPRGLAAHFTNMRSVQSPPAFGAPLREFFVHKPRWKRPAGNSVVGATPSNRLLGSPSPDGARGLGGVGMTQPLFNPAIHFPDNDASLRHRAARD
jgi:hypothetical protein